MIKELDKLDNISITELNSSFNYVLKDVSKDLSDNPFSHYLLFIEENKIVGYLNYYLIYDRIEIANFNVLDKYQNKGIGTRLLDYLIKKYPDIVNITLEVRCDNTKAIHVYEKMGFIKKAIRKGYYSGVDGLLLELGMRK